MEICWPALVKDRSGRTNGVQRSPYAHIVTVGSETKQERPEDEINRRWWVLGVLLLFLEGRDTREGC